MIIPSVDPGQPAKWTARPNRFEKKALLCFFLVGSGRCIMELLKTGETVGKTACRFSLFIIIIT